MGNIFGGSKKKPVMNKAIVQPVPQAGQTQAQPVAAVPNPDQVARSEEAERERIKALFAKGRQSTIATSNMGVTDSANIGIKKLMGS